MALTGIQITDLTNIGNAIHANDVLPIVNLSVDETQKVTVQNFGNFILGNLANSLSLTVSNLTVSNTTTLVGNTSLSNATVSGNITVTNTANVGNLRTNNLLYANGQPWDMQDPAGSNGQVQFNNGSGNFGASNVFSWDNSSKTLSIQNLNLVYANTSTNEGTSQQVLGIVDQGSQTVGWKTLPTNYVSVELRDGNTYISSITPVLRVLPIRLRSGGFIDVPVA
jgi:hypothetical protein